MILSLILPCYNPPQDWEVTVFDFFTKFTRLIPSATELIIVIDGPSGSVTPGQLNYLEEKIPGVRIIKNDINKGKGYALRRGVQRATGELIIYTDIDFPYTLDSLTAVYEGLRTAQFDIGIGVKNSDYYSHLPPLRRFISLTLQRMIRLFLSMPISDTQCGLKGFRRSVAPLFLETTIDRYLFDLEFVRNAYQLGKYKITAVPLQLRDDVQFRKMNYSILIPEMLNFVKLLFKKPRDIASKKPTVIS